MCVKAATNLPPPQARFEHRCQVASVVSDSVRPHRRQPTRLPCAWDSPGKNTGVGCHFLLQCSKVKGESEVAQSCPTLRNPMDCSPPGSSVHGIFQARVLEWAAIAFSTHTRQLKQRKQDHTGAGPIKQNCQLNPFWGMKILKITLNPALGFIHRIFFFQSDFISSSL